MEQKKPSVKTICYAAGESGGHIIPCITLAQQHKKQDKTCTIVFFSSSKQLDKNIIQESSHIDQHLPLCITRKRSWYHIPTVTLELLWATMKSIYYLIKHRPTVVVSTGGIIAIPVCIAAWLLRIPIELYELNAMPGKATKLLSHLATTIHVCFSQTKKLFPNKICKLSSYPIRFTQSDTKSIKILAHFSNNRTTLFVQGGSQGSQFINEQMKKLIETYPDISKRIQVIHQTGSNIKEDWGSFYKQYAIPAHIFSYDHNIASYYHQADLVICRSGAGALFETLFFKKKCITIPLETKTNTHQLDNAHAIAQEYPELFYMIRQHENITAYLYSKII